MTVATTLTADLRRRYTGSLVGPEVFRALDEIESSLTNAENFRNQLPGVNDIDQANLLATSAAMCESRANTLATLLVLRLK